MSEFTWAFGIGAANGIAVGFAVGPAAEKRAPILSGLFVGTPFYFIGISFFVIEAADAQQLHGSIPSDAITIASIFIMVGGVFSLFQALRVRGHTRRNASP